MNRTEHREFAPGKAQALADSLASAVELMAGETVSAALREAETASWQKPSVAAFKCSFGIPDAPVWIIAEEEAWSEIAKASVAGAGIEDADEDLRRQTWRELVSQAASVLIAERANDPALRLNVEEFPAAPAEEGSVSFEVELSFANRTFPALYFCFSPGFQAAFSALPAVAPAGSAPSLPATLERLLDVELALSVSFGRTNVPVQDLLKLASGSIIELNCPANDPVEILVHNCVIARGEVVVIEGNYGVRVKEIISRSARLALPQMEKPGGNALRLSA